MDNRTKIKLLCEIEELIVELKGLEGADMQKIGINMYEYENPSQETVQKLKNYINDKQTKEKERISYER